MNSVMACIVMKSTEDPIQILLRVFCLPEKR
jgi:hypothetical protein